MKFNPKIGSTSWSLKIVLAAMALSVTGSAATVVLTFEGLQNLLRAFRTRKRFSVASMAAPAQMEVGHEPTMGLRLGLTRWLSFRIALAGMEILKETLPGTRFCTS
jgi:hypothetical protein